jgi:hypothetical protein
MYERFVFLLERLRGDPEALRQALVTLADLATVEAPARTQAKRERR